MKVKERTNFKRTHKYNLTMQTLEGEEVQVEINLIALPVGYERTLQKELPLPSPPQKQKLNSLNRPTFGRDGKPVTEPDEEDPDYQKERTEIENLRVLAIVLMGLREDTEIQFDAKKEDYEDPKEFYLAVEKELLDANFPPKGS